MRDFKGSNVIGFGRIAFLPRTSRLLFSLQLILTLFSLPVYRSFFSICFFRFIIFVLNSLSPLSLFLFLLSIFSPCFLRVILFILISLSCVVSLFIILALRYITYFLSSQRLLFFSRLRLFLPFFIAIPLSLAFPPLPLFLVFSLSFVGVLYVQSTSKEVPNKLDIPSFLMSSTALTEYIQ